MNVILTGWGDAEEEAVGREFWDEGIAQVKAWRCKKVCSKAAERQLIQ